MIDKQHFCEIIEAIFIAEQVVLKENPDIKQRLENKTINKDEYLNLIVEEIIKH